MLIKFVNTFGNFRGVKACRRLSSLPKDISVFPDKYRSSEVEEGWYGWWEEQKLFKSCSGNKAARGTFSIILPPPNVTGHLHLGHALTVAVEDALVRWHRMRGYETIWIPGSDHAGIATQTVVEKWLYATSQQKRDDLGREEFLQKVWKWKESKGNHIFGQLKRLGASLDWDRTTFTMSPEHTRAVNEAFKICLQEGLIYRANRLVHWSPSLGSVLSDIEVDHLDIEAGKQFIKVPNGKARVGQMYDIAYQVLQTGESVVVSTTRPETILGDVAVAVHPNDPRYSSLLNRNVLLKHPLREDPIPLVADAEGVDPELGTGAVKITPNHDFNDFKVAQRLSLPTSVTIMDSKGNMTFPNETETPFQLTPDGKTFLGMSRFQARQKIVDFLEAKELLVRVRDHAMSVPICSRTGDIVEPLPKPQWFLSMKEAARAAFHYGETEEIAFQPPSYKNVWKEWFKRSEDWCLSRQLWWGHRLPMWRVQGVSSSIKEDVDGNGKECIIDDSGDLWVFGRDESEAMSTAKRIFKGIDGQENISLIRDEDVLDTWFSSSLLPFANFQWPTPTKDFAKFYPLSIMETGHDILFFWVARMVMVAHIVMKDLPFKEVMLHGMICDANGRKMSKSVGNVVDPLHIIDGAALKNLENELKEGKARGTLSGQDYSKALAVLKRDFPQGIPVCGADALRYGLCYSDVSSGQIKLDIQIIKTSAAFCNKLWQVARYLLLAKQRNPSFNLDEKEFKVSQLENRWILSQCAQTVDKVNRGLETRSFHLVTRDLRNFMYHVLCDIYVEASKEVLTNPSHPLFEETLATLYLCIVTGLKLMHPLMPFLTEELYQRIQHEFLRNDTKSSIMVESFPEYEDWQGWVNLEADADMITCMDVVYAVRSVKELYGMKRKQLPRVVIVPASEEASSSLRRAKCLIESLVPSGQVDIRQSLQSDFQQEVDLWSRQKLSDSHIFVEVASYIDVQLELQRVAEKMDKLKSNLIKFGAKKRQSPEKMADLTASLQALEDQFKFLESLQK